MTPDDIVQMYNDRFDKEPLRLSKSDGKIYRACWMMSVGTVSIQIKYQTADNTKQDGWIERWDAVYRHRDDGPAIVTYDSSGDVEKAEWYLLGDKKTFLEYVDQISDPAIKKEILSLYL